jgi:hypothetical protein
VVDEVFSSSATLTLVEDLAVAQVLNKNFIAIKVDREVLPDVDSHFMDINFAPPMIVNFEVILWLTKFFQVVQP